MYWLFKIWFGLQLLVTIFIFSLDYVDWMSPLIGDKLRYTIRGSFSLIPTAGLKPDSTFEMYNTSSDKEIIALKSYGAWARIDYSNFKAFISWQNCFWVLFDASVWLCWLLILFYIMSLLRNAVKQDVFTFNNVNYIRLVAILTGFSGYFKGARDYLLANIISNEISYKDYSIIVSGSFKSQILEYSLFMLLILVIAEFVRQGVMIKKENDLTI